MSLTRAAMAVLNHGEARSLLRRTLIASLDRKGGRRVLAALATAYARSTSRSNVSVLHDGEAWVHKSNDWLFPDGKSFAYHPSSIAQWLDEPEVYFQTARAFWYKLYQPRPGDVVLDVGAGRGEDTLPFSRAVGDTGRVISIEANPYSFRLLKKFCEANHLENVIPVHAAVADSPGKMYVVESSDGAWQADTVRRDGSGAQVEGVTIDQLCADLGLDEIAFMKMNIEGAERQALPGMLRTLPRVRVLCVCCHDFLADEGQDEFYRTRSFVEQFLKDADFKIATFPYQYDCERDHIHATRRAQRHESSGNHAHRDC